jgi:hypothetical protein
MPKEAEFETFVPNLYNKSLVGQGKTKTLLAQARI